MTDLVLPQALRVATSGFKYIDATGVTRGIYTGVPQTTAYGGDRIGATIQFTPHGGKTSAELTLRARIMALLMSLRGRQNRIYIADDSNSRRGSFPATELLTNADFSNSTTGWTCSSNSTISVSDGVLRSKRNSVAANSFSLLASAAIAVTQYVPYVLRFLVTQGRGAYASGLSTYDNGGLGRVSTSTTFGLLNGMIVTNNATVTPALLDESVSGLIAGDYISIRYASFARCALVDNGPNALLQSNTLDNASWTKTKTTITANTSVGPDGLTTCDHIVEDGTAGNHYIQQTYTRTSAAEDWCIYGYFKRGSGTRDVQLSISDGTGSSTCIFDLNAGTKGTPAIGGGVVAGRSFISAMGNGWYHCALVASLQATTSAIGQFLLINAGSNSYTGDSSSSVVGSLLGAAKSPVPVRPVLTTTTALATGTAQPGSSIYVKGLPASTAGLLLDGDWVEIDGQIKMLIASLDSDAAGLGYLQFSPPLRRAVSDNTPIIVHRPMGRFMMADDCSWMNEPGVFTGATIDLEEAFG